ncbi:MAG: Smr/MutS family protein [Bacteroidota bacterium]
MQKLKVGDRVAVLDEWVEGEVIRMTSKDATIKTTDGFLFTYGFDELVKISGDLAVTNYEVAMAKVEKEPIVKKRPKPVKPKERNAPKMEVDLHIHQLASSTKGMSNFDMLNLQLETVKRQLDFAIRRRIQKVVFIHGIGEGVLKEELRYLLNKYDNLKFYDAEYQKYGHGATEVYIFQN